MKKESRLNVKGTEIAVINFGSEDYISLTDMVKGYEDGSVLIEKWLRNKNTIVFIGIWEQLNNPDFNSPEFEGIKNEAGLNRFTLSVKKWIEKTNAKGLFAKTGRYGSGTFAQKDIAFEFGSWLSPEFKLYLIKEFQRLKEEEYRTKSLEWNLQRTLAKVNYRIHTDSIKENLIPPQVTKAQVNFIYANEADILNVALFGITAKEWRDSNLNKKGNIRDFAVLEQLIVMVNLESMNAELIRLGLSQSERLKRLNEIAINQMKSLAKSISIKKLK
ncbi:MAG: KilA-N domain-containing protein [Bacteroidetes bacterium]|nr:KilA-N domain-containing protein [Bacteroidota bacterium]